jgi:hypothetical protein
VVTVLSAVSLMSSLIAYRDAVFQMNSRIPDCPPHRANVRKMRVVSGEFNGSFHSPQDKRDVP